NDAYLVTEYVKGKTIDELQREGSYRDGLTYDITAGTCKQGGSFEVAVKLAEILCYIHTFPTPLVHGDLKPENIILTKSGEVKLIDFGSAHFLGEEPETIRSTPGFAAPEMEKGRSGLRSDVYAFGMIYAQLMSGKRLDFAGKNTAFLMRMGLNKSEAKVVQCCLNVRESQRYPSGKEVLKALKACDSKERIRCVIKQWKSFICTDVGGVLVFLGLMIFYLLNQYRGKYLILAGCILLLIQLISSSRKRISGDGEYTVLSSVFLAEN
ncbi:MAG: protein kinase, partial [Lachnospiraceae bacterium]|nr:protein kinase [Lachnospiraceae bacterium]